MRWLVVVFGVFWPALVAAQGARVTAHVTQDISDVGVTFQYQAEASVRGSAEIKIVKAPNFGELKVVGQQKSPQIITINGVTERRLALRYAVVGPREGSYSIEPPSFSVAGELLTPERVQVKIVKAGKTRRPQTKKRDSRYFIDISVEPARPPYIGEQVTLRYDLFIDGAQMDVQPSSSREPSLDDFWIQDLTGKVARQDQMVSVQGRLYKRTSLWAYAVFPLRAGPIEVEPAAVDVVVGSFFRRGKPAHVESEALKFEIRPLPPDAPKGFYEGNVGNWSLKVSTDQSRTRVGRAIVVEVRVVGEGQVTRVRLPELPAIEGTRLSDVDEESSPKTRGTTVGGIRVARYSLTPQRKGNITIPSIEFSYFDPAKGKYRTLSSEPIVVGVAAGQLGPAPVDPAKLNRRNLSADEDLIAGLLLDLGDPRGEANLEPAADPARFPWPYWPLIGASFLAFVGLSFGPRIREFAKRTAPEREQRSKSRSAIDSVKAGEADPSTLAASIRAGLVEAYGIPRGAVTAADIERAFEERGLDADVASELAEVLAECESARFAREGTTLSGDLAGRARKALEILAATLLLLICCAAPLRASEWPEQQAEFRRLSEAHPASVDAQYNLGTAAAHTGEYGAARRALERASYLAPWDPGVEHNRAIVERIVRLQTIEQSRTGRTMEGDETLFWWRVAGHVNPHLLGIVTALLWLLATACIRVRRRSGSPAVRDAAVVALVLAVVLGSTATFGAFARSHVLRSARPVTVASGQLELREGPNAAAKLKRKPPALVPGTLLRVVDEREGWVKVSWQTDAGWTRADGVAPVN